jgi:hypothetical protein
MDVQVTIGKQTKWLLINLAVLIACVLLWYVGGREVNPVTMIAVLGMLVSGTAVVCLFLATMVKDLEGDSEKEDEYELEGDYGFDDEEPEVKVHSISLSEEDARKLKEVLDEIRAVQEQKDD